MENPYRIIRNYGCEGRNFDKEEYATAEEALEIASRYSYSEFKIVKLVEFQEKPEG